MRVTEYDRGDTRFSGDDRQRPKLVKNVNAYAAEIYRGLFWQGGGPRSDIVVAANGGGWGEGLQRFEDVRTSNVARVKNVVDAS